MTYQYFKFREINKYLLESLMEGTLYFASPEKLNDPFDCNLDVKKAIINASSFLDGKYAEHCYKLIEFESTYNKLKKEVSALGICSFSLELENTLLWSHYANDHKGVCILYEFSASFFDDGKNNILGTSKVTYKENSLTNWFMSLSKEQPKRKFKDFVLELAQTLVTLKSPAWKYENEARIIRMEQGLLEIPVTYIKQICFGLNVSDEDIEVITKITSNYEHKVDLCKVVRDESDFGITVQEI